jgi:hypothetical protein
LIVGEAKWTHNIGVDLPWVNADKGSFAKQASSHKRDERHGERLGQEIKCNLRGLKGGYSVNSVNSSLLGVLCELAELIELTN